MKLLNRIVIDNPSPFQTSLNFLEPRDIIHMMGLSKEIRKEVTLSFQKIIRTKTDEKIAQIKQYESDIKSLETNLKYLKEQDQVRELLVKETDDKQVQDIIYRYIVQPKRDKKAV